MSEELSLDEILSGESAEESQPEPETEESTDTQEVQQPEETQEDESKQDEKEPEKPEEESKQGEEPKDWSYHAYKDEKAKRQALEKRLEELESKSAQPEDKTERPSVFEDQNAFADSLKQEFKQELAQHKLQVARELMLETYNDYEANEKLFVETVAKENPILAEQARKAANPAKFVYQQAKKYKQYQEMQDVDAYKAKLKAEVLAELKSEKSKPDKTTLTQTTSIKPSSEPEQTLSGLLDGR